MSAPIAFPPRQARAMDFALCEHFGVRPDKVTLDGWNAMSADETGKVDVTCTLRGQMTTTEFEECLAAPPPPTKDGPVPWEAKVGYIPLAHRPTPQTRVRRVETTAYLELKHLDGTCTGVNKHTDEPVRVRWINEAELWVEVPW